MSAAKRPPPLSPVESVRAFTIADDLEIELVLAESLIARALHLGFDERGRLWIMEYRQHPAQVGLQQISHNKL